MRRTSILLLAGLAAISCTSIDQMAEVRFSSALVEEGSMTKTTRQETIQAMISSRLPKAMDLRLKSAKTGTMYDSSIGGTIMLPVGRYGIAGQSDCANLCDIIAGMCYLSTTPQLKVSQTIEVTTSKTDYPLDVKFGCFGLVIDVKEVAEVTLSAIGLDNTTIPFEVEGDYGIAFVNGDLADRGCQLTIHPQNLDNGEAKKVILYGIPKTGGVVVEQGKYYIVHPTEVEKVGAGFQMNIPTMSETDLK